MTLSSTRRTTGTMKNDVPIGSAYL